jgi:hypothetical protein
MRFDFFTADNVEPPAVRVYDTKSGNTVIDVYILPNVAGLDQLYRAERLAEGIVAMLNSVPRME